MRAYYNDNDAAVAQWLRNLIAAGLLPEGDVDDRSIADVQPSDLAGYTQCHFFAGIGGWPYALSLAGWPANRPVWTGSCPCQPFSAAGRRKGEADERHLWPEFYRLIRECRPFTVFGEQVDGADGLRWLAGVSADLEAAGYAVGAVALPAASVAAPHDRARLWWVADTERDGGRTDIEGRASEGRTPAWRACPPSSGMADAQFGTAERQRLNMARSSRHVEGPAQERERLRDDAGDGSANVGVGLADTDRRRLEEHGLSQEQPQRALVADGQDNACGVDNPASYGARCSHEAEPSGDGAHDGLPGQAGPSGGFWGDSAIVWCDERAFGRGYVARRVEPGTFPLAHGVPARLVKLRGYGNAIVPQVAAAFVSAYLDARAVQRSAGGAP